MINNIYFIHFINFYKLYININYHIWGTHSVVSPSIASQSIGSVGSHFATQVNESDKHRSTCYAVHRGRQTGVFLTWALTKPQIDNFPSANYRKFNSRIAAAAFVLDGTT